jgi:Ca-activated chloride channel family protein
MQPLSRFPQILLMLVAQVVFCLGPGFGQAGPDRPLASNVILPQRDAWVIHGQNRVELKGVSADIRIDGQMARTSLVIDLYNPGYSRLEAEVILPVPSQAVVSSFTFDGAGAEPTVRLLRREEARRIYERIVAQVRDPAILEFVGYSLVRSCVFPVEPHKEQHVRLTYEQLLARDGLRIEYALPRSESLDCHARWAIRVRIHSNEPVSTVYSPTHDIDIDRTKPGEIEVRVTEQGRKEPGPFYLTYLPERAQPAGSFVAYPDPQAGGGYFLFLMGLPAGRGTAAANGVKREITLVLDRSGSMKGLKLQQAQEAALQIIRGLSPGETFNLISYNEVVDAFAAQPVPREPGNLAAVERYIGQLTAQGGTNIYEALLEALHQPPTSARLPLVLFLTDGAPTVGKTSEKAIRELVTLGNPYRRRVFTIGVGTTVNAPLLDALANNSRGSSSYIEEHEDLTSKISRIVRRMQGPVFSDVDVNFPGKGSAAALIRDGLPSPVPDLFEGDQLVLLGRYTGNQPFSVGVGGRLLGQNRTFEYSFDPAHGSARNGYVPRLWAGRKIAQLIDAVRQLGADASPGSHALPPDDPRISELTDEIVRLSLKFGILTEYTAFLAEEGTDLSRPPALFSQAREQLEQKAVGMRVGSAANNQARNLKTMASKKTLNISNNYLDAEGKQQAPTAVQQMNDKAFFRKGNRWIDSRLGSAPARPHRIVRIGSPELIDLAEQLARENRQGSLALKGEILLEVNGEVILVQ